jgi:diguanylate cyclase (GGDEF)-like protein
MQLTHVDPLTSLPNRIAFNEGINRALMHARRHSTLLALLLLDIDHFHEIKKKYGITISNLLLEELGRRLSAVLRADDTLAHLETDEFAVLLTDVEHPKLIGPVAEKLLKASSVPFKINSQEIQLTISIGVGIFPEDGETLEDLQKHAAATLYQAKHQGGNLYQFSLPQRMLEAQDYIKLQDALRHALKNNEFLLHYQPKLDLKTWAIRGVEALIRWKHPELGLIDPVKFIPSAEETGLIIQIGEWTLREACRMNKEWQNEGYQGISMAVNLSPKQFYHPELKASVEKALRESSLDPLYLELEITEMTIMDDIPKVNALLHQLKDLGLALSIDDFGTGHTSLSYLKDFPINAVKIDQSFIKSLPEDSKNAAITTALIILAHQLDIKVIAEGVETMEQLQFLSSQNCDQVQGYFVSRPVPASKIAAQLTKAKLK